MKADTHAVFGAACWAGGCLPLHPGPVVVLAGAVVAGAAAPWCDIDNLGTWRKRRDGWLVRWRVHPVQSRVSWWVTLFGSHRQGPCHSLAVLPLLPLPLLLFGVPWWLVLALAVGLCSHPVLDLLNVKPVRLFWPAARQVPGAGLRVGGMLEQWVRALAWAGLFLAGLKGLR